MEFFEILAAFFLAVAFVAMIVYLMVRESDEWRKSLWFSRGVISLGLAIIFVTIQYGATGMAKYGYIMGVGFVLVGVFMVLMTVSDRKRERLEKEGSRQLS